MSLDCTTPRPSITDLHTSTKTEISTRMLNGAPVLPMSNEDVLAFIMAGVTNMMHGFVSQGLKESDPADMCCDNLVAYAARRGIYLQAAERARGVLTITGTPGAAVPGNIRFVGEGAQEYKLDPSYITNPTVLDGSGSAVLFVAASGGGVRYNLPGGAQLTVSSTIPNIDILATVSSAGVIGGADDEECETLRARVLDAEAKGTLSTNVNWFVGKTLTFPGVTRACNDECEGCCEQGMLLYPFFDGAYEDGVPPQSVIDAMNLWMFGPARTHGEGLAPIGVLGEYRAAVPTVLSVVLSCVDGCAPNVEEVVATAVAAFITEETCVGSKICLERLAAAITNAVGKDACLAPPAFNFDGSLLYRDDAFAYLACGHYLKLGTVS